jgi:methionine synthase II (cobalamin-independent)
MADDNGERLRAYLEAHIRVAGKYPLEGLADTELAQMAMMLPTPSVDFTTWERKVYGVKFEEMTEAEAAAINEEAQAQSKEFYGK